MIIAILTVLGLCLGSFVNALTWRLQQQSRSKTKKYSIMHGRSMCPHCSRVLGTRDLIPVVSWLALGGKCRYCGKPISWQYPAVEISTALLFVTSYVFWPSNLQSLSSIVHFSVWLACLVGFVALVVYDVRYMILPNKIIFPLTAIAIFGVIVDSLALKSSEPLKSAAVGLLVGGGLFYVLFQLSNGAWIGGGDVKLGFLLGILIGGPALALLMLFIASLLGTIASLPLMVSGRLTPKTRIPFGPFLITGAIISQLFGQQLVDLYMNSFL